jgi:hypothetical protein
MFQHWRPGFNLWRLAFSFWRLDLNRWRIVTNHLARNLGESVPKYDIHIQRLGVAVKEQTDKNKAQLLKDKIDNANLHSEIKQACDEMFTCLEHETGLPRGWIDLILWKACMEGIMSLRAASRTVS